MIVVGVVPRPEVKVVAPDSSLCSLSRDYSSPLRFCFPPLIDPLKEGHFGVLVRSGGEARQDPPECGDRRISLDLGGLRRTQEGPLRTGDGTPTTPYPLGPCPDGRRPVPDRSFTPYPRQKDSPCYLHCLGGLSSGTSPPHSRIL